VTIEAAERMAAASVQNAIDFFAGRLDLVVNRNFLSFAPRQPA